ncbi:glycosyltransferase [Aurantibacter crassamenti]|uniref:glycosyltransferase n=1 Tax=Aurantibacter crassamenti TaxID=1837375 RepID=UPI001939CEC6|nr:glycosyltransferase [Aurantibacter crassamenti]MBM1105817.1 glycosyltransferase [Aurantibacter crassamenti]
MTRVLHLQTHLPSSGNAAFRLHRALNQHGVHSTMLTLTSEIEWDKNVESLGLKNQIVSAINGKFYLQQSKKTVPEFGLFSYPILGNNISKHPLVEQADIIYFHWTLAGFLSIKNMKQLAKLGKPIIVFMHDVWYITGGCHYNFTCDNYQTNCGDCQVFSEGNQNSLSVKGFQKKNKFYSEFENLNFVAPSSWLTNMAKKSGLTKNKPVYHIPNVIDHSVFKPIDKNQARKILNLNADETIISFGAASPNSPYKGWSYLKDALGVLATQMDPSKTSILLFGSDYDQNVVDAVPFKVNFLGYMKDDRATALVYNAADVFVAPSMADNLPTTVMESLCCGTPVTGFDIGGIPDMIHHKKNGYLAEYKNSEDLAEGILYCLNNEVKGYAPNQFDTEPIINRHIEFHTELLSKKPTD